MHTLQTPSLRASTPYDAPRVARSLVASPIATIAAIALAASIVITTSSTAEAQNKPFPYKADYVAGFTSNVVTADDAKAVYATWKKEYLKTDCGNGMIRVEFNSPTGSTVSEGMGYGMLLTAYFGDRAEFDGLWKFVQKNFNSNHVMGWKVTCGGFDSSSGGNASAAFTRRTAARRRSTPKHRPPATRAPVADATCAAKGTHEARTRRCSRFRRSSPSPS